MVTSSEWGSSPPPPFLLLNPFFPLSPLFLFSLLCSLVQVWEGLNKPNKYRLTFLPLLKAAVFLQLNHCIALEAQHISAWFASRHPECCSTSPVTVVPLEGQSIEWGTYQRESFWGSYCPALLLKQYMGLSFFPCNIISCVVDQLRNEHLAGGGKLCLGKARAWTQPFQPSGWVMTHEAESHRKPGFIHHPGCLMICLVTHYLLAKLTWLYPEVPTIGCLLGSQGQVFLFCFVWIYLIRTDMGWIMMI